MINHHCHHHHCDDDDQHCDHPHHHCDDHHHQQDENQGGATWAAKLPLSVASRVNCLLLLMRALHTADTVLLLMCVLYTSHWTQCGRHSSQKCSAQTNCLLLSFSG